MTTDDRHAARPERVADGAGARSRGSSTELRRVMLGKEDTIDEVVAALLARGHVLLEGLPGLGKTELVKALSRLLSLDFRRIQFTPDLLPTDITGSHILQERDGRKEFASTPGPVFTNLLLADEINRASPKTQSALLEAMQERRVTTFGETRPLPRPFFVLATQNPIELEGTYPLPEAQLDRFMFKVDVAGVDRAVLEEILVTRVHGEPPVLEPVLTAERLARLFALVDAVHLPRAVANYIARLVAASHPIDADAPDAGAHVREVRQLAARRDCDWRGGARAGAAARQAERRLRRGAPRGARRRWRIASCSTTPRGSKAGTAAAWSRRCSRPCPTSSAGCRRRWRRDRRAHALRRRVAASALSLVAAAAAPPRPASTGPSRSKRLRITVDTEWALAHGARLLPVRFDITNLGDARIIEIVGTGHALLPGSRGRRRRRHRACVSRPAGARRPRAADDSGAGVRRHREHPVRDPRGRPHARTLQLHRLPEPASCRRRLGADRRRSRQPRSAQRGQLGATADAAGGAASRGRRGTPAPRRRCRHSISCSSRRGCRPTGSATRRCGPSSSAPAEWEQLNDDQTQRAADLDRLRRQPALRRRRARRRCSPGAQHRRRVPPIARVAAISSGAFTCRASTHVEPRASPSIARRRDSAGRQLGAAGRTAPPTGAHRAAGSGCRFPASTAFRPAPISRSCSCSPC